MRYLLLTLCTVFAVLSVQSAQAAGICFVKRVLKRADGVAVTFDADVPISVTKAHLKPPETISAIYQPVKLGYQLLDDAHNPVDAPVAAIPMAIGDSASIYYTPENGCTVYAVRRHGKPGIMASAFFYSQRPGEKPETRNEFIAAEPIKNSDLP